MANYRNIQTSFWTDAKIAEEFSPEERYMYLYLMTNPHTNACGCYELGYRLMAFETGYSIDKVKKIIISLSEKGVIAYSEKVSEILLVNWHKYNWTKSDKLQKLIQSEIEKVKTIPYREYLSSIIYGIDTVSDSDGYPIQNTFSIVSVSNNVSVNDSIDAEEPSDSKYQYKEVVDYLNTKAGTAFKDKSKDTKSHIKARFDDGFTLEDFKTVIDKKTEEWRGSDMEKYLRPSTLFGTKFESYLNQKDGKKTVGVTVKPFIQREYDYDAFERELLRKQGTQ